MDIMAIRDLIPWSRQENRLSAPVNSERDSATHPLLSLHREVNRLFDDVLRGFGVPSFAGFDRNLGWPQVELAETERDIRVPPSWPASTRRMSIFRSRKAC
jgi:HSP20 family protein